LRLELKKIYKVVDNLNDRRFYVQVMEELSNWEYDYNTYKCKILCEGSFYGQSLILVTEMWTISEATDLEIELL
jgi:hypothetical protein